MWYIFASGWLFHTDVNIEGYKVYQLPTPGSIIGFSLVDESDEDKSGDEEDEIATDFESSDSSGGH